MYDSGYPTTHIRSFPCPPTPAEILAVARPRNTFVAAYGKSKDRYAVRKYVGCRYDHGRHIPIKGPTIGHIRDGKFIPTENDPAFASGSRRPRT